MNIKHYHDHCCGCGECAAVCPVQAITMRQDKANFFYPFVDEKVCIDCSRCVTHCSFNNLQNNNTNNRVPEVYAMKHSDPEIRAASRSGGIFTTLSDFVLDAGGVVYGSVLENCREAVHIRATTKAVRDAMRGSKYIQSKTHGIFDSVKKDLQDGHWVLFSGTPCQVNAVADYCKNTDCEKLLLVDIVCHGVPSPKIWSDYLTYLSRQHKKEIVSVNFRDKQKFGWAAHRETVVFADGTDHSNTIFRQVFYDHYALRKSCFACPYRSLKRPGDISIADCWGIAQHYPEFDDNRGVSMVLVNTTKGRDIFTRLQNMQVISVDVQKLMQPALKENWDIPKDYDHFWRFYHSHSFDKVIDRYVKKKPQGIAHVKMLVRRFLGKCYRTNFKRKRSN